MEDDEDFSHYLATLRFVQKKHAFKLFNYELMNTHVHLFLEPGPQIAFSRTMHLINWKYARDYNRRKNRTGHLWMDRFKCIPVESNEYALSLMRYINRNPLRAGMVEKAGEWRWSGFRFYAQGEVNNLLEAHPTYLAMGPHDQKRQEAYRAFVEMVLPHEDRKGSRYSEADFIGSETFGERLKRFWGSP